MRDKPWCSFFWSRNNVGKIVNALWVSMQCHKCIYNFDILNEHLQKQSMVTRTTTMKASMRQSSVNTPQSLCYPNTDILTQQPNSGGPAAKLTKFSA